MCRILTCQRPTPGVLRIQDPGLWPPSPWAPQVCSEAQICTLIESSLSDSNHQLGLRIPRMFLREATKLRPSRPMGYP